MNFVIQTDLPVSSTFDIPEAAQLLHQVHGLETVAPLVIDETKYHYLQIDNDADIDALIAGLMELPSILAAYPKPADELPGF